jgi:hypothetical protein
MATDLIQKDTAMTLYHVTFEAAGDGAPPTSEDLDMFLELLGPDATVLGPPETGAARYGAEVSVEADSPFWAINYASEVFGKAQSNAMLPHWPVVRVSVLTDEELDAELARPTFPELVGIREIAGLLDVTPQRVSALCRSGSFPLPAAELRAGPVWTAMSVRRFVDEWKRQPGRPRLNRASA